MNAEEESRQAHRKIASLVAAALAQIEAEDPRTAALIRRYVRSLRAESGHYRRDARAAQAALRGDVRAPADRTEGR